MSIEMAKVKEMFPTIYSRYKENNNIFRETLELIFYIKQRDDYPLCTIIIENIFEAKLGMHIVDLHNEFKKIVDEMDLINFVDFKDKYCTDLYIFYRCIEQIIIEMYIIDKNSTSILRVVNNVRNSSNEYAEVRLFTENNKWIDVKFTQTDIEFMLGLLNDIKETLKGDKNE